MCCIETESAFVPLLGTNLRSSVGAGPAGETLGKGGRVGCGGGFKQQRPGMLQAFSPSLRTAKGGGGTQKIWKPRLIKMMMLWCFFVFFLIKNANDCQAFKNHTGGWESLL